MQMVMVVVKHQRLPTQQVFEGRGPMNRQQGLSLVELMIAITLGLFLMAGVVQMFIGSKVTFTTQQAMSRVQETGRLAIDFIARDMRMAGYTGFRGPGNIMTNDIIPVSVTSNYAERVSVFSAPVGGVASLPNTDILVIRGAASLESASVSVVAAGSITVALTTIEAGACLDGSDRISGLCRDEALVISDYVKSRAFRPTAINIVGPNVVITHAGAWGDSDTNPNEFYSFGAQVTSMTNTIYFIANGAGGRPSLFQQVNDQVAQELLEGVSDMYVTFSRADTATNYEIASTALNLAAWENVDNPPVSIRVDLLTQSVENNVLDAPQVYQFAGQNIVAAANDLRMYQVFTTTIALRNQL